MGLACILYKNNNNNNINSNPIQNPTSSPFGKVSSILLEVDGKGSRDQSSRKLKSLQEPCQLGCLIALRFPAAFRLAIVHVNWEQRIYFTCFFAGSVAQDCDSYRNNLSTPSSFSFVTTIQTKSTRPTPTKVDSIVLCLCGHVRGDCRLGRSAFPRQ